MGEDASDFQNRADARCVVRDARPRRHRVIVGDQGHGVVAYRTAHVCHNVLNLLGIAHSVEGKRLLDFGIETKADTSPLTIADKKAHNIILEYLEETGIPVLSEEGKHIPFEERSTWFRFWLVDPLDGTKEFINRNGEFTVNIALVEEGLAIFGVVYAPVINELYVGIAGRGAYRCTTEKNFDQPLDYLLQSLVNQQPFPLVKLFQNFHQKEPERKRCPLSCNNQVDLRSSHYLQKLYCHVSEY